MKGTLSTLMAANTAEIKKRINILRKHLEEDNDTIESSEKSDIINRMIDKLRYNLEEDKDNE